MEHLYIAIDKLANGIYSAVILNIRVILSIIERVSIKRLTEDLLLIITGRCNTWSIISKKYAGSLCVINAGANNTREL